MSRIHRFISHCFWALLSLLITMVIVLGAIYTYMELQLPNVNVLKDAHLQVPLRIYSRDGKLITQYGTKRRVPVTLDQVPKQLIQAVLATEDARYYSHPGVDFISLVRAAKAVISSGRKVQGASTITMQVARNFFLSSKKTYGRKIKEILLALKIDKELSKDKVLELYLNKVYFGNRAYGVAAAAQVYYGKKLKDLTLPQMAMLAGLPQAPSRSNPLRRPRSALNRRNHVLSRMLEVGFIDRATYQGAIKAPMTAKYHGLKSQLRAPYVAEMVRRVMVAEYGQAAYEKGLAVYTTIRSDLQMAANHALQNGLIAYSERHGYRHDAPNWGTPTQDILPAWQKRLRKLTTPNALQPAVALTVSQQSVQALLANGQIITINWPGILWARRALKHGYVGRAPQSAAEVVNPGDQIWLRQLKNSDWRLEQLPIVQGAIVSINPINGEIMALDGGFDYELSHFNRVVQAERQPGSNFKPFIYSAALAKDLTLASLINDAPVVLQDSGENQLWRPHNDTLKFYGPTRLKVGLTKSRNLVSIRVLQDIGIPFALNYVTRFGFNPAKLPHALSLALGSGVVTPLQIGVGYSVFANGGFRITPHFTDKILDENGQVLYQANPKKACTACITDVSLTDSDKPQPPAPEVVTPQNAFLITQALRGVIQTGTGRGAKVLKRTDLAGKTGTTNNQVDAWFSGFNSKVVTAVWVGFDNMKRLHEYGSQAAMPIWIQYMRTALEGMPESTMPRPTGIITVRIDPRNGQLANPDQTDAILEDFREKLAPKEFSTLTAQSGQDGQQTGGQMHSHPTSSDELF